LLANEGIPGIKYLDGTSRTAGDGTRNFVMFNPEDIRILERNGVATGQQPWSADLSNYAGKHRPPMADNGGAPLHDLTGGGQVYPDDIYSPKARQYYGTGEANDAQLFRQIQSLKGKPDAMVTAYRAVPKDVTANAINHGDWVTINKQYAIDHGEGALNGEYKILQGQYPAKSLFTNGDSPYEYGLDTSLLKQPFDINSAVPQ
jgi:hypothetical protein